MTEQESNRILKRLAPHWKDSLKDAGHLYEVFDRIMSCQYSGVTRKAEYQRRYRAKVKAAGASGK